jgi:hypothetical protein
MTDGRPAASTKLLAIVGVLTFVSVAATIGVSFLLWPSSARTFPVNVGTAFLALVETVIGLLVAGSALRRRGAGPGGAATPVLLAIVVIYAVVGFVSIGAYSLLRRDDQHEGWLWAALLAETALAFLVCGSFWGAAEVVAAAEAPALARRAEHAGLARQVREAVVRLRALTTQDPVEMRKADALVKRLEAIESALAHSQGGGVGSREGGGSRPSDPSVEQDLASAAQMVAADAASLGSGTDTGVALDRIAAGTERLRSAVDRLS